MAFVKWDCGCVGLKTNNRDIVIEACDRDYESSETLTFTYRETDREFINLTDSEIDEYCRSIDMMLADGFRFRKLKTLIND
jgi:hypothetical protein